MYITTLRLKQVCVFCLLKNALATSAGFIIYISQLISRRIFLSFIVSCSLCQFFEQLFVQQSESYRAVLFCISSDSAFQKDCLGQVLRCSLRRVHNSSSLTNTFWPVYMDRR
ncbi:Hypothetical_protein [Hexamita inflata]|uniref:Hypothetical_protein n=1 Tax=Hexamita inflata TaxID=28002 RepID=A0AA86PUR8_9EUKA|nr:Hypothetical protein HINF_LOCUS34264 [Hexamita inflata]CAI9949277.1 Hypothetical protein HINF_LOCUS36922 [Hexamita inflata]